MIDMTTSNMSIHVQEARRLRDELRQLRASRLVPEKQDA